jgi:hypothetical protein
MQAGRVRVNMGNVHYGQESYGAALKMYRMALDGLGAGFADASMKARIQCNIGLTLLKLGDVQVISPPLCWEASYFWVTHVTVTVTFVSSSHCHFLKRQGLSNSELSMEQKAIC